MWFESLNLSYYFRGNNWPYILSVVCVDRTLFPNRLVYCSPCFLLPALLLFSFMKNTCVKVIFNFALFYFIFKTQEVNNYSCAISNKTVRIVKNCPKYEEKWREAATKMNCTAYADKCSEPKRLEYHCVINTFVNQTLEVCAYGQNILQGCTTELIIYLP